MLSKQLCNVVTFQVDDDVEEDDEWEEGAQEIGIVGNEVDELGPTAREIEGRRRGTNLWE